ncbi:MAG: S-layer homology domain-containing protein [Deltaproteobacteria bacterium]
MISRRRSLYANLLLAIFLLGLLLPGGIAQAAAGTEGSLTSQFKDVGNDSSNLVYINYMNARGILGGFPDGTFRPDQGLTRAQAAVIISKAVNLNVSTGEASGFTDVAKDHWANNYVAAAVKAGYLKGFADGSYRPEQPLTRVQGISLIMRLSKEGDSGVALPQLSDMESSHWAARAMAMAIDAGMIGTQGDSIRPDQPISRGDISRALSLLLTSDPQLSSRSMMSTLTVKSGEVTLSRGSNTKQVSGSAQAGAGDTIQTKGNGEALLNYPDGSSLLLKANTTLTIKESQGRAYIKKDGKPGIAVDNLVVEMKIGKVFGGLSSLAAPTTTAEAGTTATSMNEHGSKLLAASDARYDLLAAGEEAAPWYKTAQKQKVKVKVDMPWGVAAIRGSFWQSAVNSNGSGSTNLLEGSAQVIAGGQAVSLSPGEASGGSTAGGPPSAPAPMTAQQASEWTQVQSWVTATATTMTENQGAPPAGEAPANSPGTPAPDPANALNQALNEALNQVSETAANPPSTPTTPSALTGDGGGGDGGVSSPAITISDAPDTYYIPNMFPGLCGLPTPGQGKVFFTINPDTATITCSESGTDVVDVAIGPVAGGGAVAGGGHYIQVTCKETTPGSGIYRSGMETLCFTATAPGYTSATKTVNVWALPPLGVEPSFIASPYTTPASILVHDDFNLWTNTSSISLKFIEAGSNDIALDLSGNALTPITPSSVSECDFLFALNSQLPLRQYEYVISVNGTPSAIGPLKVYEPSPELSTFALEPYVLAGFTKFSGLGYTGADHYLFRMWQGPLGPPSLGEQLDTTGWVQAKAYLASPFDPGTPFMCPAGSFLQVAAVDAANHVMACTTHPMISTEIAQAPRATFSKTAPTLVPGIWVSSTRLTGIEDSACASPGGYKWMWMNKGFSAFTPADQIDISTQELLGFKDCNLIGGGTSLPGLQAGYHIGFMGYDSTGKVQVFLDHPLDASEVAITPADNFTASFTTITSNTTTLNPVTSSPTGTDHYAYIYVSGSSPGGTDPLSPAALGSDGSCLTPYVS